MPRRATASSLIRWSLLAGACLLPAVAFAGQAAAPAPRREHAVTPFAINWTRLSSWRFFEPPPGGGDPHYTYLGNRLRAGLRWRAPRVEVDVALQYVQFAGLPTRAVGPGPLGTGALYFEHSGRPDSGHVYLRYLGVRARDVLPGLSVQAGRFGYTSGAESPSGRPTIEAVKRQRVDARLIGEFEWSLYQRSFDGVRLDYDRPAWHATVAAFRPTQGGFEDAAGARIGAIDLMTASVSFRPGHPLPAIDWQVFVHRYDDRRQVSARPDNTGRAASRADIAVTTVGTTLVGAAAAGAGEVDALIWVAGQTGTWYELAHRAWALAAETGYQWPAAPGRPSRGATRLGTVLEGSLDYRASRHWTVNGYLGVVRGGEVVRRTFAGRWLAFGYVEQVVQF